MDIGLFITGFVLGGIAVYIPILWARKNEKLHTDMMYEQMKLYFENTANKVFAENSSNFSEQSKEKLEEFFKRFKDKIEDFEKRTQANFENENDKLKSFDTNLKNFLEAGQKISTDTTNLINVMKSDNKTTGKWGEILLERVLEASGLRLGEEFEIQKGTSEGRPDAVVNLPAGRCIYIDSKTSFSSWYDYVNAIDENEKAIHLKQFTDSTKAHIKGLAKRDYATDKSSPDYVLMFIPIEGCYSMMFCDDCALWDFAWKNNVMPVSPSTLLAALKIIEAFHKIDKQNKNIMEMAKLCAEVHDKFAGLLEDLNSTRKNFDNALKKLNGNGNIISKIEKIEKLGAPVTKELPKIADFTDEEEIV